ncbi:MAG: Rrf2 family transcriptional regulator [Pseudomonadota bacterium]
MRLTEQTRYALRVLAYCAAHHPSVVQVHTVAQSIGLTEFTIFKLLRVATKAGLINTVRGRHGGIQLAQPPEAISIGIVVRAFEPRFNACAPAEKMAVDEGETVDPTPLKVDRALGLGIAAFFRALDEMTVADLVPTGDTSADDLAARIEVAE